METWAHLCNTNNKFYTLTISEECKECGLNHKVQSLRFDGYRPTPLIKRTTETSLPIRRRIAALFLPKELPTKIDENQHDYYDRQG
jgi:hypothetical protein